MSTRKRDLIAENTCFFVTTTFRDWVNLSIHDGYYQILGTSLHYCLSKYQTDLIAYVFMPNHVHLILFFQENPRLSDFMRDFKKYTSTKIRQLVEKENRVALLSQLRYSRGAQKFKIWKDRFDAVVIRHRMVLETKLEYIHWNPVKKGLAAKPEIWKYSSAGFYSTGEIGLIPIKHFSEII